MIIVHMRLINSMLFAIKKNKFPLYNKCAADMAPIFYSFGGQNYSRFLTWFDMFLTNIEITHPGAKNLLEKGILSIISYNYHKLIA